ncbi:sulfurtransferase [Pseudomonas sp. ME-P-057]|jgi:thiosulfate/3-mercaptopyruvate sulfurtransferase|uniref:sulfurtransferase n=1 Tax=Pseudomonas sp. ME-P-057 TaxID=3040321 RepID=UPI0025560C2D|nr:sulfurtransferase [Pseudomonas sp. ME-P-057]
MSIAQLISPQQLAERLTQPGLVILDCRSSLDDLDYGQRSYAEGHIEGSSFADLLNDLSGAVSKGITGRHPLPDPQTLIERLRFWGVNNQSDIVLYDDGPGAYAARAWWLLAWLGKREGVYVLDGGLKAWHAAGLPLSLDPPQHLQGTFEGAPDDSMVLTAEEVHGRLGDPAMTLIDARARTRFRGEVEPIDPVAGHIPGAQCAAFTDNLGPDGRFLSADQLKERFAELLESRSAEQLVAYCGSGVTACHNLFALCLAGYPLGALYAGSWSEWINDPQREIATGD